MLKNIIILFYKLNLAGSTGNCKISDLFEKFVFWS